MNPLLSIKGTIISGFVLVERILDIRIDLSIFESVSKERSYLLQ